MPRFLHTYTGEFHWVADPSKVVYAILSHTWRPEELGGEQSYASIQEVQAQVGHTTKNHPSLHINQLHNTNADPGTIFFSDGLSDKIKDVCRVARNAGYQLIWIDSGCIDKSSSAELAEAINSMFELYRLADVCYVYLADVPDGDDPRGVDSQFQQSRWHARGWTLQELIAPKNVVFLTQNWTCLGTKNGLASILEQVTRVDVDILVGRAPVHSASVARRMSWAATRETTRVEDEAYSLLGIFDVHLSPIYGEGRNAFLRLQEEIIKSIPDQSIFAWGNTHMEMGPLRDLRLFPGDGYSPSRRERRSVEVRYGSLTAGLDMDPMHWHSLLAPSPVPFRNAHNVVSLTPPDFAERLHLSNSGVQMPPLRCLFTPQGVGLTLLTIGCAEGSPSDWISRDLTRSSCSGPRGPGAMDNGLSGRRAEICEHNQGVLEHLALLQCEATSRTSGKYVIALALLRPTSKQEQNMGLRVAARPCECWGGSCRLVYISRNALRAIRRHLVPTELNLRRTLPAPSPGPSLPWTWSETSGDDLSVRFNLWSDSLDLRNAFCVAPWCKERLDALGIAFSPLQVQVEKGDRLRIALASSLTSHTPPESGQAEGAVGDIEIMLSLTQVQGYPIPTHNTMCRFSIKTSFRGTPRTCMNLHTFPSIKFHTGRIQATLHKRAIHEAVFDVTGDLYDVDSEEECRDQQQNRRLLRLALECPSDYLYSASRWPDGIDIPCLWVSIELSDVFQFTQSPNASEVSISPTGSVHSNQAKGFKATICRVLEHYLGSPENVPQGLRARIGPVKQFLGNTGLQILRQPKKLVESIRSARRRIVEGPPPRSWS